jgi:hypothetical protein
VYRKFFRLKRKNLKDLCPSYLKATQSMLITADPRTETSADVISELGRGKIRSSTIPIRGAAITIDVNEYFPEVDEEPGVKDPEEAESLHLCRNSAFSKHNGQYSAITNYSQSQT